MRRKKLEFGSSMEDKDKVIEVYLRGVKEAIAILYEEEDREEALQEYLKSQSYKDFIDILKSFEKEEEQDLNKIRGVLYLGK